MKQMYEKYLPPFVRDTREFQILSNIEGDILQEEKQAKQNLESDQWIITATERGLNRRAKLLNIVREQYESLEDFRQRILFLWNHHSPYTYFHLLDWLEGICEKENVNVDMQYNEYHLHIEIRLIKKQLQDEIRKTVRKMIPANILLDVTMRYNLYGEFKPSTNGDIKQKQFRYIDLREDDVRYWKTK